MATTATRRGTRRAMSEPKEQDVSQRTISEDHTIINKHDTITNSQKIDHILDLKTKINALVSNIRDSKVVAEKYENENQYLQDYIGSLMKSGELK